MSTSDLSVLGIDLSKDWLDAHLLPADQCWHISADAEALQAWIEQLPEAIDLVVMEASGGLQNLSAALFARAGFSVAIVNPGQVRAFAKAIGQQAKTDAVDARLIAQFGQQVKPASRPLPDDQQALLGDWLTRRGQLMQALVAEGNRLGSARFDRVRKNIQTHIDWLTRQLDKIDRQIDEQISSSPIWRVQEQLLTSVKGVGPGTARHLIAHLPELGQLDRRQIAALAGLAPYPRDSGRHKGARFIRGGRAAVRRALYMAALSASRSNPALRTFYRRLIEKGKPHKLALTAVMRKLLVILNAIIRDQQPWSATPFPP